MKIHELKIRIPYADIDQMGVVYYSNYLVYFERGRTEFFRDIGIAYKAIEDEYGLYLPVKEVRIEYMASARYDNLITVKTWIAELGRASMQFDYEILNEHRPAPLIKGSTMHVFVNKDFKPTRIPPKLADAIAQHALP
jgi:acyl-CoA thioester hydrolase